MLRARDYPGSVVQLRRYVRTVRPTAATEAYLRLDTLPGEQAQVDWGHFGTLLVGRARRALSCFVFVLAWSRACSARFALDQTLESFLRGHVEAFAALQGVPRTILYDNLKSVVLERVGDHIRFHPQQGSPSTCGCAPAAAGGVASWPSTPVGRGCASCLIGSGSASLRPPADNYPQTRPLVTGRRAGG